MKSTNPATATTTEKKYLPLLMWISCAIFYGYQYLLQVSPNVMANDLMRSFSIDATALGNLAACYFYTYALMQIPVGMILDRFGARLPMTIAAFICAAGCFLFASTSFFPITILSRLLIGIGSAFAIIGTMYVISKWFTSTRFALLLCIAVTIGMLGAAFGQAPLAIIINAIGWRNTMLLLGCIGIGISLLLLLVIRNKNSKSFMAIGLNQKHAQQNNYLQNNDLQNNESIWFGLKQTLCSKQIWLIAMYGVLLFMPTSILGSLWGIPFLMQKYRITNTTAGSIMIFLFLGWIIGGPFFGWLSDKFQTRKKIFFAGSCGTLISILFFIYIPETISYLINALFIFIFGFFSSATTVIFAAAKENNVTRNIATVFGFTNAINMIGGAVFQPIIGWFLDLQWQGTVSNGIRIYSTQSFKIGLTVIPMGLLISLLILFFIKETYYDKRI